MLDFYEPFLSDTLVFNFRAKVESFLLLRFEPENVLNLFLKLRGIVFQ